MNIAIIGTRGVPNHYGGFEQFAEYLSEGLFKRGHDVTVYNSSSHPYQRDNWKGVRIIHCYDPENKLGTAGQFIYDLNCILDTRRRNYDIILQLGYTSSSVWGSLLPRRKSAIATNMDGMEWKRSKYSHRVQKFLMYAEKLAVKYSDFLIADSVGIQKYLAEKYSQPLEFIPYGANLFTRPDFEKITSFKLLPFGYNMLVARLEPENSIEVILDGVAKSQSNYPFLVVGKHKTKFGSYLKNKFGSYPRIRFIGGVYNIEKLNNLRHFSNLYFHGHTVGGTNPSLLEAMASQALICAHNNIFNRSILDKDAFYFKSSSDVAEVLDMKDNSKRKMFISRNEQKINELYNWDTIIDHYLEYFEQMVQEKSLAHKPVLEKVSKKDNVSEKIAAGKMIPVK